MYNHKVDSKPYLMVIGGIDLNNNYGGNDCRALMVMGLVEGSTGWAKLSLKLKYLLHHHQSAVSNGCLFVVGGAIYNTHSNQRVGIVTDVLSILNFKTGLWRPGTPLITPRAYFGMVKWRNKLILVAGEMEANVETDELDIYDIATDSWNFLSRHPGGPRLGVATAVLSDKLYVVGGYSESTNGRGEIMDDAYSYDLITNQWSILNYLDKPISHASLVVINHRWAIPNYT